MTGTHRTGTQIRAAGRRLLAILPHERTAFAPLDLLASDMLAPVAAVRRWLKALNNSGFGIVRRAIKPKPGRMQTFYAISAATWAKAQAAALED